MWLKKPINSLLWSYWLRRLSLSAQNISRLKYYTFNLFVLILIYFSFNFNICGALCLVTKAKEMEIKNICPQIGIKPTNCHVYKADGTLLRHIHDSVGQFLTVVSVLSFLRFRNDMKYYADVPYHLTDNISETFQYFNTKFGL